LRVKSCSRADSSAVATALTRQFVEALKQVPGHCLTEAQEDVCHLRRDGLGGDIMRLDIDHQLIAAKGRIGGLSAVRRASSPLTSDSMTANCVG